MLLRLRPYNAVAIATAAMVHRVARRAHTTSLDFQRLSSCLGGVDDLLVLADFDRTLTTGRSDQCHDVMGAAESLPAGVRDSFVPLLDFSKPFPPELQGDAWWRVANDILVAHGGQIDTRTAEKCVADSNVKLRPGTKRLLRVLSTANIPLLIVSAGYRDGAHALCTHDRPAGMCLWISPCPAGSCSHASMAVHGGAFTVLGHTL